LTEGHCIPIGLAVDGANRHDMTLLRSTLDSGGVKRPQPTAVQPQGMCLDKGYDYQEVRAILAECVFTAHMRSWGAEAQALKK
jgi:putative transposase